MKESYLKIEDEIENLKKAVIEGNSAKIELARLQKKFDRLKMLASKCVENDDDGGENGDGENKENEAGN